MKKIISQFDASNILTKNYYTQDGHIYRRVEGNYLQLAETLNRKYLITCIKTLKGYKNIPVHRLVFAGETGSQIKEGMVVHHLDGNKQHNTIDNLKMIERGENVSIWFKGVESSTKSQQVLRLKNPEDFNTTTIKWVEMPQYGLIVNNYGQVFSAISGKEKFPKANPRFKTNLIVSTYNKDTGKSSSISYGKLMVEAFQQVPENGKYKVLSMDSDNLLSPFNYYIVLTQAV